MSLKDKVALTYSVPSVYILSKENRLSWIICVSSQKLLDQLECYMLDRKQAGAMLSLSSIISQNSTNVLFNGCVKGQLIVDNPTGFGHMMPCEWTMYIFTDHE